MRRTFLRTVAGGGTLASLMVAIAVIAILAGLVSEGYVFFRARAELALLGNRCNQLGVALSLFHQRHRRFPDAYPASLETDLAQYVGNPDMFLHPSWPEAGAEPLNHSYVCPISPSDDRYVLGLDAAQGSARAVVLFVDGTTEAVDSLPVLCSGEPAAAGSTVTGGTILFDDGSQVELEGDTTAVLVRSFRTEDATTFHIVKHARGEESSLTATSRNGAIVEVASYPALIFTLSGEAGIKLYVDGETDIAQVRCVASEVLVDGRRVDDAEDDDSVSDTQNLLGSIRVSPSNNPKFEFQLEKPDGQLITRDDLRESDGQLEYAGPARMIRLRPQGDGNDHALVYNGEAYPVYNGRVYTITGSNISAHLHQVSGVWVLDDLMANDAQIVDEGQAKGEGRGRDNRSSSSSPADDDSSADSDTGDMTPADDSPAAAGSGAGRCVRSLGRGTTVGPGDQLKFTSYR
jgi:type II secretory pathway pseudopilin PulG